jgi:hypothetical protein
MLIDEYSINVMIILLKVEIVGFVGFNMFWMFTSIDIDMGTM